MKPLLINFDQVCELTNLSRTSIRKLMKANDFPNPVNTGVRVPTWRYADVETWVNQLTH